MWTQADADRLKAAIVAIACGEGVQRVRYDGPPAREVTYHPTDLGKMRELLAEMLAELTRKANPSAGYRLLSTRKGV